MRRPDASAGISSMPTPPGARPVIIPAATVALLIGSIRIKLPVARFRRYGSENSGLRVSMTTAPMSFRPKAPAGSLSKVSMLTR